MELGEGRGRDLNNPRGVGGLSPWEMWTQTLGVEEAGRKRVTWRGEERAETRDGARDPGVGGGGEGGGGQRGSRRWGGGTRGGGGGGQGRRPAG